MSVVGNSIKKLRSAAGMSQYDLSRELGIHPASISSWERGVGNPDLEMVSKVAKIFNVSTDFILGNEGYSRNYADLPEDLQVSFRQVDWNALSEDERRILHAVIKSVTDKHKP